MFVVIGIIGALLLLSSLLFDDVIDDLIPDFDFLSGPVIGAFLAAFGLFGWFVDSGLGAPAVAAVAVAVGGGTVMGTATYKFTNALFNQPTDATPTTASLVGKSGHVVTAVRAHALGEVVLALGGATTKYTVTADDDIPTGAAVVVIGVESPTKLRVEAEAQFFG